METKDWRHECARLQAELDIITKECNEWKEKFERALLWQKQPRLPVRGLNSTLDCVGTTQGKVSTQTYTTVGWQEGDDGK
jgi:hypothetical protein